MLQMKVLVVLSKGGKHRKILDEQWEKAVNRPFGDVDKEYFEKYRRITDTIIKSMILTMDEENKYLTWCEQEVGLRIDAIVGKQYRGSYHKAAGLLVAMAETMVNRKDKQYGLALIEKYRSKYPRYSAFKSHILGAIRTSGL